MDFLVGARRAIVVSGAVAAVCVAWPGLSQATTSVLPGFDLLETRDGATRVELPAGACGACPMVVALEGIPVGVYDFGSGNVSTGKTDTIIQRTETATVADPQIAVEVVVCHFRSQDLVDLGDGQGPEVLDVALNQDTGSTMTINGLSSEGTPHGTFDSELRLDFDVSGSKTGYINTYSYIFAASGEFWNHENPYPSALRIAGVNYMLNTSDTSNDFHPRSNTLEEAAAQALHIAKAESPSLATGGLILLGGLMCLAGARTVRRRRQARE